MERGRRAVSSGRRLRASTARMTLVLIGLLTAGCATAVTDMPSSLHPVPAGVAATRSSTDDLVECRLNYGPGVECHLTDEEEQDDGADAEHRDGAEQDRDRTADAELRGPGPSGGEGGTREAPSDAEPTSPTAPTDADRTDRTGAVADADGDRAVGPSNGAPGAATTPTDDAPATQAGIDVPTDDADAGSAAGFFLLLVGAAILVASSWIAPLVAAPRKPGDRPRR